MVQISESLPFNRVFLAGRPFYTDDYLDILRVFGVFVHGIIVPEIPEDVSDSPIPIIPIERYAGMLKREIIRSIPLIILDHCPHEGISFFVSFVDHLCTLTQSPPRIYHSSYLARFISGCCDGEIACTGYPGTGCILMINLISALQQFRDKSPTVDGLSHTMRMLGKFQTFTLLQYVKRISSSLNIKDCNFAVNLTFVLHTQHLRAITDDGNFFVIDHLPWTGFIGEMMAAHILWCPTTKNFFQRNGYKVFHATRNPIDTIASNAAKTYRPLTRALYSDEWFKQISRQLSIYNRLAIEHQDAYTLVKYEDIIKNPLNELRKLSNILEIDISDQMLEVIWNKLGFKPLTRAGDEHLYKPGQSKLKYFTSQQIETLELDGHESLSKTFGYEWPDKAKQLLEPLTEDESKEEWKTPSQLYGRIDRFACHRLKDERTGVTCIASAPQIIEVLRDEIEKQWFDIFFNSLGLLFESDFSREMYDLFPG